MQNIRGEAFLFAQEPEQQMLGPDVLVVQPFGFLGAIRQHALALMAQRQVDGSRNLFPQRGVRLDLLADGFHRRAGAQEAVGERLVFAQQAQQQMLGLDARAAELAGLVAGEEDHSPGFFGITFKHSSCPCSD